MGKTRILQKFLRSHTPIFDETTGFTRLAVAGRCCTDRVEIIYSGTEY
jgi:hypothetical protein